VLGESTHSTKSFVVVAINLHASETQFVSVLLSAAQTTQHDEWQRIWKEGIMA
jgi:hypothetical protein